MDTEEALKILHNASFGHSFTLNEKFYDALKMAIKWGQAKLKAEKEYPL